MTDIPDDVMQKALADLSRYEAMTGAAPQAIWHQATYDDLVSFFLQNGRALLAGDRAQTNIIVSNDVGFTEAVWSDEPYIVRQSGAVETLHAEGDRGRVIGVRWYDATAERAKSTESYAAAVREGLEIAASAAAAGRFLGLTPQPTALAIRALIPPEAGKPETSPADEAIRGLVEGLKPFAKTYSEAQKWKDFEGQDCSGVVYANAISESDCERAVIAFTAAKAAGLPGTEERK